MSIGQYHEVVNGIANGSDPPTIPKPLLAHDRWLCYRLKRRPDGKLDKIPTDPDVRANISKTDPANWMPFEQAFACAATQDHLHGVGFVLTDQDPFAVIDLDSCRDPETDEIEEWAWKIIRAFDSYTEISVSGTGVHIWVNGTIRGTTRPEVEGRKIEAYSRDRFITVTGIGAEDTPLDIMSGQDLLDELSPQTPAGTLGTQDRGPNPFYGDDDALVGEAARIFKDGFTARFGGDTAPDGGDQSQSRSELIGMLRWLNRDDADQIERVMWRSGLDQARWTEPRDAGRKTRLRWEIDRLTSKPKSSYYESGDDLDPRIDLILYKTPHEINKEDEQGSEDPPARDRIHLIHGRGVKGLSNYLKSAACWLPSVALHG